jgi:hypothetical protein
MLPCSNLGQLGSRARAPHGAPEDGLATAPLFGHVLRRGGSRKFKRHFFKNMKKGKWSGRTSPLFTGFIFKAKTP